MHAGVLTCPSGLQTPRLKRLAEIVSAQAIAQQEKMEESAAYGGMEGIGEDVQDEPIPAA